MSEKYQATGTIRAIGQEQTRGSFTFQLLTLMIEDGKYPQTVEFQLASRNLSELEKVKVNDKATVHFNLRGREWTKPDTGEVKVFNTLDAWKIEPVASADRAAPADDFGAGGPDMDEDIPF
jgi:single-strand DNA-binding protein